MSFQKTTETLVELCETLLKDVPKALKGNKSAAQRIRTGTIKISKISKMWRKESLEQERKQMKKRKSRSRRKKS